MPYEQGWCDTHDTLMSLHAGCPLCHEEQAAIPFVLPDEASILAMDGTQLGQLSWALGLAPVANPGSADPELDAVLGTWSWWDMDTRIWLTWEPQVDVAQADALCRQLQTWQWATTVFAYNHAGHCLIERPGYVRYLEYWPAPLNPSEAVAILRAACLAAVHQKQGPHDDGQ